MLVYHSVFVILHNFAAIIMMGISLFVTSVSSVRRCLRLSWLGALLLLDLLFLLRYRLGFLRR